MIKSRVSKDMTERNIPIKLLDYCVERCASVRNLTSRKNQMQGQTLHTDITGEQLGISNLYQFGHVEWLYRRDDKKNFPEHKERLEKPYVPVKGHVTRCVSRCHNLLGK